MSTSAMTCTDCGADMEGGFFPELGHGGAAATLNWQPGAPDPKYLLGFIPAGINVDATSTVRVTAFRCTNCGLLKLYALNVPAATRPKPSQAE